MPTDGSTLDNPTNAEWRTSTLGECAAINPDAYSPKEAWPFINYLDTGSVTENLVADIQRLTPGEDKIPARARRKVRQGDIVYSTVRPNQKHYGIIKDIPDNFLVSTGFAVIRAKQGVADTGFIYYFLTQAHIVEHLHIIAEESMTAYPAIRPSDIERLEIPLPPLPAQRAIARILGAFDDKIALNAKMNATLEAMARALFQAWFVNFEPVRAKQSGRWRPGQTLPGMPAALYDLFPAELTPTELGDIPAGWGIGAFGDIVSESLDKEKPFESPDAVFNHFSLPAYNAGKIPTQDKGSTIKSVRTIVKPDTVLLSRLNPQIPRVWLVDVAEDERAICSTEFMVLSAKAPFRRNYIYFLGQTTHFHTQIKSLVTGTIHQRARAPEVLSRIQTLLPDASVLKAFDELVADFTARALNCKRESLALAAMRDALLPKLLSGEVRVG